MRLDKIKYYNAWTGNIKLCIMEEILRTGINIKYKRNKNLGVD